MLATLQCPNALHGAPQMIESQGSFFEEPIAGWCRPYAGVTAFEEFRSNAMFQAPDAPAHC